MKCSLNLTLIKLPKFPFAPNPFNYPLHEETDEETDSETPQINTTPEAAAETVETPDRDCRSATTAAMPDRMTVRPPAPLPDNYLVGLHQCASMYPLCINIFLFIRQISRKIGCS